MLYLFYNLYFKKSNRIILYITLLLLLILVFPATNKQIFQLWCKNIITSTFWDTLKTWFFTPQLKYLLTFGYLNNKKATLTKCYLSSVFGALQEQVQVINDQDTMNVNLSWSSVPAAGSPRTREVQLTRYCERERVHVLKSKQVGFKDYCFGMAIGGKLFTCKLI